VSPREPVFRERLSAPIVRDAWLLAGVPLLLASVAGLLGWTVTCTGLLLLAGFVVFFFRNPQRSLPGDERTVVAPADGRVIEAGEFERPDGGKAKRVAIFLSVFNVHVNRIPVAGRVLSVERGGKRYLAAFDRRAGSENARCEVVLETARGERVGVVQIVGLIARRIVCHAGVGEWVDRGARYGLIRFGSRTDVVLPVDAELLVQRGDRVRGGRSVLADLPRDA
jgi:phosphatidylserine decarboxylase